MKKHFSVNVEVIHVHHHGAEIVTIARPNTALNPKSNLKK